MSNLFDDVTKPPVDRGQKPVSSVPVVNRNAKPTINPNPPQVNRREKPTLPPSVDEEDPISQEQHLVIKDLDTGEVIYIDPTIISEDSNPPAGKEEYTSLKCSSFEIPKQLNYAEFVILEDKVDSKLLKWVNSLWFAPGKYAEKICVQHVSRVYVPYWLITCVTKTDFSAKVAHTASEIVDGESITETTWEEVEGVYTHAYNDILLCAAHDKKKFGVFKDDNWKLHLIYFADPILRRKVRILREQEKQTKEREKQEKLSISGADTLSATLSGLSSMLDSVMDKVQSGINEVRATGTTASPIPPRPKDSELLAFKDWNDLWKRYEKKEIQKLEKKGIESSLLIKHKSEKVKDVKFSVDYKSFTQHLVYLPVYQGNYIYNAKVYKFLCNGHSGRVVGERALGAGKVAEIGKGAVNLLQRMARNG